MAQVITYGNVALQNTGKTGILKKLDNDYYEIALGAFGAIANGGWVYDQDAAMRYIQNNPDFIRLLKDGKLASEWGHPFTNGLTDREFFERVTTIDPANQCTTIRKVNFSTSTVKDKDGRAIVTVIGEVRPSGPKADEFRRQLENPHENVCFSIRCFADKNAMLMRKYLTHLITFDKVTTPGIANATKYQTPSLESKENVAKALDTVSERDLDLFTLENHYNNSLFSGYSTESSEECVRVLRSLTNVSSPVSVSVPRIFRK